MQLKSAGLVKTSDSNSGRIGNLWPKCHAVNPKVLSCLTSSLMALVVAGLSACGSSPGSNRNPSDNPESVFDSDARVLDGTGVLAVSKPALVSAIEGSALLADFALGRLFDFDLSLYQSGLGTLRIGDPVFCAEEIPLSDSVAASGGRLEVQYEADVTACSKQLPSDDEGSVKVDRNRVGFKLTFVCSSKDVAKLAELGSAKAVLGTPDALVCPISPIAATTGRSYRYAAVVDGRYVGPRSEVPIKQKFWRGYESGGIGEPCLLSRSVGGEERLGLCRFYERSESENLVDQSRSISLMTAEALPRTRNGSLFNDGTLRMSLNGWSARTEMSSEDSEITMDFSGPGAECARFSIRPAWVNFRAADCRRR